MADLSISGLAVCAVVRSIVDNLAALLEQVAPAFALPSSARWSSYLGDQPSIKRVAAGCRTHRMPRSQNGPNPYLDWRVWGLSAAFGFQASQLRCYRGVIINDRHGAIMTEPAATRNSWQTGSQPHAGYPQVLVQAFLCPLFSTVCRPPFF